MNKIKTLSFLVGILALINIGLLIFLLMGPPRHKGPKGMRGKENAEKFIQMKFGFDEGQMKQFRRSKVEHMNTSKALYSQLDKLSAVYYNDDSTDNNANQDSLLNDIQVLSEEIYRNNKKHFDEVRGICRSDQLPELENFINGLIQRNGSADRPGKRRKK